MSPAALILHRLVRGYQYVFAGRPSPCRYVPSCSNYALDALESHGALRGGWLSARRVCRCHPWGGHGWDPIPGRVASREPIMADGDSHPTDLQEHRCPGRGTRD